MNRPSFSLLFLLFCILATVRATSSDALLATCLDGDNNTDTSCNFQDIETASTDFFITTWQTTSAGESITITINPDIGNAVVDYDIDWGDGSANFNVLGSISHTFASKGEYTISIQGDFPGIQVNQPSGNADKLLSIDQWGSIQWTTMDNAFTDAEFMKLLATDRPNLKLATNTSGMFWDCANFNTDINHWDVGFITDMGGMFAGTTNFNKPLSDWNVGKVTCMSGMFAGANSFNQTLNSWDVDNVTDMSFMFTSASSFNQPLDNWDVDNVTDMSFMFQQASSFNQTLNSWDCLLYTSPSPRD